MTQARLTRVRFLWPRFALTVSANRPPSRQRRKKTCRCRQFLYRHGNSHRRFEAKARIDRCRREGAGSLRSRTWERRRSRHPKGRSTTTLSGYLFTLGVQYHESQGVKFHLGSQLERIIASESDPKFATGVELIDKDGQKQIIEADFVVVGAGVSPATDFLKQSDGFPQSALRKDGGVLVDECLRVRGLEDVFAIGDIAVYPQHPLGEETRIEHWNVAGNHGRAVGKTISGTPVPFSKIPIFWSGREYHSFWVSFDLIR